MKPKPFPSSFLIEKLHVSAFPDDDEYIGLSDQHPASFRRYLRERILEMV